MSSTKLILFSNFNSWCQYGHWITQFLSTYTHYIFVNTVSRFIYDTIYKLFLLVKKMGMKRFIEEGRPRCIVYLLDAKEGPILHQSIRTNSLILLSAQRRSNADPIVTICGAVSSAVNRVFICGAR